MATIPTRTAPGELCRRRERPTALFVGELSVSRTYCFCPGGIAAPACSGSDGELTSAAGAGPLSAAASVQSPAQSLVPLTVPTNLQAMGAWAFASPVGFVAALGEAPWAKTVVENKSAKSTANAFICLFPLASSLDPLWTIAAETQHHPIGNPLFLSTSLRRLRLAERTIPLFVRSAFVHRRRKGSPKAAFCAQQQDPSVAIVTTGVAIIAVVTAVVSDGTSKK